MDNFNKYVFDDTQEEFETWAKADLRDLEIDQAKLSKDKTTIDNSSISMDEPKSRTKKANTGTSAKQKKPFLGGFRLKRAIPWAIIAMFAMLTFVGSIILAEDQDIIGYVEHQMHEAEEELIRTELELSNELERNQSLTEELQEVRSTYETFIMLKVLEGDLAKSDLWELPNSGGYEIKDKVEGILGQDADFLLSLLKPDPVLLNPAVLSEKEELEAAEEELEAVEISESDVLNKVIDVVNHVRESEEFAQVAIALRLSDPLDREAMLRQAKSQVNKMGMTQVSVPRNTDDDRKIAEGILAELEMVLEMSPSNFAEEMGHTLHWK